MDTLPLISINHCLLLEHFQDLYLLFQWEIKTMSNLPYGDNIYTKGLFLLCLMFCLDPFGLYDPELLTPISQTVVSEMQQN